MELFALKGLTFSYPGADCPSLDSIDLAVERGEFIALTGPSGSGKSTLLRLLKPAVAPSGDVSGEILFCGKPVSGLDERGQAARIGFVCQRPDEQLVTDKVWHELAFGLESLGAPTAEIRRRVAEMASFFGIENWFYRDVSELSGGQKQLLNLASVMAMQPDALVLDEPTSQLDPIAASDFLSTVGRINRELGTTVIMSEHRLDDVFPLCTRVIALERGRKLCEGAPAQVGERLLRGGSASFLAMPAPMRAWAEVERHESAPTPCPVTVADGRRWLRGVSDRRGLLPVPPRAKKEPSGEPAASMDNVWFRYGRDSADVLKGLTLAAYPGELYCILGGNGAGKSTALAVLSGLRRPYRGEAGTRGRAAALPQDPQTLFLRDTVREELFDMVPRGADKHGAGERDADGVGERRVAEVVAECGLSALLDRHPYDLSGGEQQRAALAKLLITSPDLLLLDEPTKGVDAEFKRSFAAILRRLTARGVAVVMVSHDVEFCAEYADRCALFFDGAVIAEGAPDEFFASGSFYTTAAARMSRGIAPGAVTVRDVAAACGAQTAPEPDDVPAERAEPAAVESPDAIKRREKSESPPWRKLLAAASGLTAVAAFVYILQGVDLGALIATDAASGGTSFAGWSDWPAYAVFAAAFVIFALSARLGAGGRKLPPASPLGGKLSRRALALDIAIFALVPLTVLAGVFLFGDRKYYFVSLLLIVEIILPFFISFEGRKPRARDVVTLAALCALGVAGRAVFAAIPGFKPVLAVVTVAGAAFGGSSGFLVGAVTMFASNILFGQGPWTPWQMLATGLVGLLSGLLFSRGRVRATRASLTVYGFAAAVVLYGGIMNPASVLMYQSAPSAEMFITSFALGLPVDLVHASSTALFLWLAGEQSLGKIAHSLKR